MDGGQKSPPPLPPDFCRGNSRPETGTYFGLAFPIPRPQTVNLTYQVGFELLYYFSSFLVKSEVHNLKSAYKLKRQR